jgi:hypothetical protein
MRSASAAALLTCLLAACDQVIKEPPKGAETAVFVDSAAERAAADSARKFSMSVERARAPMALTVSGAQHFSADSAFTMSCVASESNGDRLLQVEGLHRNARVNFTIYNPREGDLPVGNNYARRAHTRIGNLEVSVGTRTYGDGRGAAEITDPTGRSGALHASSFIKMGVKRGQSHAADIAVHLRWHCE